VIGTKFTRPGTKGDFSWMIQHPQYEKALFIFNDNEEQHASSARGGGNATIRPYNKHNKRIPVPRSAGIPTGTLGAGGYQALNDHVLSVVDSAVSEIEELIEKYQYTEIYYSAVDDTNPMLGTGIFDVDTAVKEYITSKILALGSK
jgi:hypothetical protein